MMLQRRNAERRTGRKPVRTKGMTEDLLGGLRDPDHNVRSYAGEKLASALTDAKTWRSAVTLSVRGLRHPDVIGVQSWARSSVRSNTAYALTNAARKGADIGPAGYALVEGLSDRNDAVQSHCRFALMAGLANKRTTDNFVDLVDAKLSGSSPEVRKSLLLVLGESCEKPHVHQKVVDSGIMQSIANMLSDGEMADAAFRTSKKLLEAGLKHKDREVGTKVKQAYVDTLKNGGNVSDSLPPLVDADTERAWEVVRYAADKPRKRQEIAASLREHLKSQKTGSFRDEILGMLEFLEESRQAEMKERAPQQ